MYHTIIYAIRLQRLSLSVEMSSLQLTVVDSAPIIFIDSAIPELTDWIGNRLSAKDRAVIFSQHLPAPMRFDYLTHEDGILGSWLETLAIHVAKYPSWMPVYVVPGATTHLLTLLSGTIHARLPAMIDMGPKLPKRRCMHVLIDDLDALRRIEHSYAYSIVQQQRILLAADILRESPHYHLQLRASTSAVRELDAGLHAFTQVKTEAVPFMSPSVTRPPHPKQQATNKLTGEVIRSKRPRLCVAARSPDGILS
jgi:hypothetical protein